jgi:hypothetical protein
MKYLLPTAIVFVLITLLAAVFIGIPAGIVHEEIEVIESKRTNLSSRGGLGPRVYLAKVRLLSTGDIITLSSRKNQINSGVVSLKRNFSPMEMKFIYNLVENESGE